MLRRTCICVLILWLTTAVTLVGQDQNNANNIELTNEDHAFNWALSSNYSQGTCTIVISGGSGVPSVGSHFFLEPLPTTTSRDYYVTGSTGSGPVTLTLSPCLQQSYTSGTKPYWLPDLSTFKTFADCTPADATEVCVEWESAHASDSRVVMTRYPCCNLVSPSRQACAVADPCPMSGAAGDSTTHHVVRVKNLFPRLNSYGLSQNNALGGFWVSSRRTDNGSESTLGHTINIASSVGSIPVLYTALADPTPANYGWKVYTFGPPDVYQGAMFGIQLAYAKLGGNTAPYTYVKSVTLDDGTAHACTHTYTLTTCVDGITVQLVPSELNYMAGSPSSHYLITGGNCNSGNRQCMYDPDYYIGLGGFYNGTGTTVNQAAILGVFTTGATSPGVYSLTVQMQGTNGTADVGTGATFTYSFAVLAPPTFNQNKATIPATIYNYKNSIAYMSYFMWQYCEASGLGQNSGENNFNSLGVFENSVYGPSDNSLYFYGGPEWLYEHGDTVAAVTDDWLPGTSYAYGTLIKPSAGSNSSHSVYYVFPTAFGALNGFDKSSTSALSQPNWAAAQAWGSIVADGNGTSYFNVGTRANYNQCGGVVEDAYINMLQTTLGGSMGEFSGTLNRPLVMDHFRHGNQKCRGSQSAGCAGGTIVSNQIDQAVATQVTLNGAATVGQNQYKSVLIVDPNAMRASVTMLEYATAYDVINNTDDADTVVKLRVDSMLGILRMGASIRSFADTDYGSQSWVMGDAAKAFYVGIAMEALIDYYNRQIDHGLTPDYRIPTVIKQYLDWQFPRMWAKTPSLNCGSASYQPGAACAFKYEGAAYPEGQPFDFATTVLNNLSAMAYCWMYDITADATYRDRCNLIVGHSIDNPGDMYARKAGAQQRAYTTLIHMMDLSRVSMKSGQVFAPSTMSPTVNPCDGGGSFPCSAASVVPDSRILPFNFTLTPQGNGGYARRGDPIINGLTSVGATFYWETPEPTQFVKVVYGTSANNCNLASALSTDNVQITPNRWSHTVTISNASASTLYYAAPWAQDLAGNIAQERCNSTYNALYTFTTLAPAQKCQLGSSVQVGNGVKFGCPH